MRIQKTVGSAVTNYHYNGSLLMAETTGNAAQYYSYDANGNLISLYYNNAYYYYLRNGQGDIVGLLDNTGAPVVAYTYDAWGKALSVTGTLASTLGTANPFRYRGYYYDAETGLYYLQSRYYDPVTCRFLNGDVLMSTGQGVVGHNLFAYCGNNPVNLVDPYGLEAYDLFDSLDDAATDFAICYNAVSIANNLEYGARVYSKKVDGKEMYYYAKPFSGNANSVLWLAIPWIGQVSSFHTHSASFGKNYNYFSDEDKMWVPGKVIYIATPNGSVQKYDKKPKQTTVLPQNNKVASDIRDPSPNKTSTVVVGGSGTTTPFVKPHPRSPAKFLTNYLVQY